MRSVIGKYGEIYYFGKDEYVGRSIHNYGEFSPDECDMILSLAKFSGKLCLDIGANIGAITQMLAFNGLETIAFEPQPAVFGLLSRNFSGCSYNVGLSSLAGSMKMPRVDYSMKGNFGGLGVNQRSSLGTIDVEVRTLDSYNFTDVGFIKIDVEGHEIDVLRGGYETIMLSRPIMYIEDDRTENSGALRQMIHSLDYTIEEHEPYLYREDNFFALKKNIWAPMNYVSKNLICRPNA